MCAQTAAEVRFKRADLRAYQVVPLTPTVDGSSDPPLAFPGPTFSIICATESPCCRSK